MSRVEGNIFFPNFFFFEKVIIDAINVIKTNNKNVKNKWRVNSTWSPRPSTLDKKIDSSKAWETRVSDMKIVLKIRSERF